MLKTYKMHEICLLEKGKQIDTTLLNDSNPYQYINGGINASGYYDKYNTDENTVIVSEGGASCGYVNYVTEKFWCGCHCYKLINPKVTPKYLYYALKGNQNSIMELRTGAAMPNIKKSSFNDMSIKLDDDKSVHATVISSLDSIQTLIDSKNSQLKQLDELVKSRFIEMFGDFFNGDSKYPLIKISNVVAPKIERASKDFKSDDLIRYVDISSINNKTNVIVGYTEYIKSEAPSRAQQHVKANDIVVSTVRPILNNVARIDDTYGNIVASSGFCVLRAEKIESDYLFGIVSMQPFANYLSSLTTGANYPAVSDKDILNFMIPYPSSDKQKEYAAFVKQVDKSKFVVSLA